MPHATNAAITVTPFDHAPGKKTNFGAILAGVNLNSLDEESFNVIREAVYTHNVVVVKGQDDLLPAKQFEFVNRFDPDAKAVHGFGTGKNEKEIGPLGKKPFYHIPGSGGVTLVGHGYQGGDHYGFKDVTLDAISHVDFHAEPLSAEELAKGQARFNAWHFDGIIYGSHPSRVTTFRCVRSPKGPDVTVQWNDGTGGTMKCPPGSTAFISGAQLYDLLSEEEKEIADCSSWEPAPHPFAWSGTRGMRSCGFGMAPGGKTLPLDDLPKWTPDKVYRYPLVWINPVTGEKSIQLMAEIVRKFYFRNSPDGSPRVVDDEEEIRCWINNMIDRIIKPEYILIPPCEEGDMVVWNNWGVVHSAVEYPLSYGSRSSTATSPLQ